MVGTDHVSHDCSDAEHQIRALQQKQMCRFQPNSFMPGCQTSDKDVIDAEDPDKIGEVAEDTELRDQSQDRMKRLVGYGLSSAG
jgi:hypothetical protein